MFCHDIYNRHSWQIGPAVSSTGTLNTPCYLHWFTVSVPQIRQLNGVCISAFLLLFLCVYLTALLSNRYYLNICTVFQLFSFFNWLCFSSTSSSYSSRSSSVFRLLQFKPVTLYWFIPPGPINETWNNNTNNRRKYKNTKIQFMAPLIEL